MTAPQKNTIDDAVAAVAKMDYQIAESILSQLNDSPSTRSLHSLFLYAQVLEAQGRLAPTEQLVDLAGHVDTNEAEQAHFYSEMATLVFRRSSHSTQELESVARYLKHSLDLGCNPNPEFLLSNLCRAYSELRDYKNLSIFAEQLFSFPDFRVRASLLLAHSCLRLNDNDKGNSYLDSALSSVDNIGEVDLSSLFDLLLSFRRNDDAHELIDTLRGVQHRSITVDRLEAQLAFAEHRIDDALTILTDSFCRSDVHDNKTRIMLFFMRGRCLDEGENHSEAFAAFRATNEMTRRLHGISGTPDPGPSYKDFDYASLPEYPEPESTPFVPTFMIGFPRSGTTLLETVLDTQDDILTLSETEGISKAITLLRSWGMSYPQDICRLSEDQVQLLRSAYFDHNSHLYSSDKPYSLVIDKLPLYILHIPLILTLFPNAKFLMSLRHPMDVCLSCFQQMFEINKQMAHFTDLEDTFKRYARVMGQFEEFRASLEFPMLTVRYEDLVGKFDAVIIEVFDFLGLRPSDAYKDFHVLGSRKPVLTPSNIQVNREIYKSSCERWRNYANELEEYLPLVEDFVARYGYERRRYA